MDPYNMNVIQVNFCYKLNIYIYLEGERLRNLVLTVIFILLTYLCVADNHFINYFI